MNVRKEDWFTPATTKAVSTYTNMIEKAGKHRDTAQQAREKICTATDGRTAMELATTANCETFDSIRAETGAIEYLLCDCRDKLLQARDTALNSAIDALNEATAAREQAMTDAGINKAIAPRSDSEICEFERVRALKGWITGTWNPYQEKATARQHELGEELSRLIAKL